MRNLQRFYVLSWAIVLTPSAAASATDAVQLTLFPSRDLGALGIGESANIDVVLSGLDGGATLDSLFAAIAFDDSLLKASSITAGEIVPLPLSDPADFLATADDGLADVAFSTFSTEAIHHLSSNGLFFRFEVTAIAQGNGKLVLDFVSASRFNVADPASPIDLPVTLGPPLEFTVVPEPASLWLLFIAAWGHFFRAATHRRRAR